MEFRHQFIEVLTHQRVFVIGDIHGRLEALKQKLLDVSFNEEIDLLISVGDLIDRGPNSVGVLRCYEESSWFKAVAGNHELMMSNAMKIWQKENKTDDEKRLLSLWWKNGGDWSLDLPYKELEPLLDLVDRMPHAMTCLLSDGRQVGICHAQPHGLNWQDMQHWKGDMYDNPRWIWGRTRIKEENPKPVIGVDCTVHGHTKSDKVVKVANSYFIDTGSSKDYQGEFTLYELVTGVFY